MQENLSSGFPTKSDTNRAGRPQKMARGLKFRISEVDMVEKLYYLYSENKGTGQLPSWTAPLFSHMQKSGFLMMLLKLESLHCLGSVQQSWMEVIQFLLE